MVANLGRFAVKKGGVFQSMNDDGTGEELPATDGSKYLLCFSSTSAGPLRGGRSFGDSSITSARTAAYGEWDLPLGPGVGRARSRKAPLLTVKRGGRLSSQDAGGMLVLRIRKGRWTLH